MATRVALIPARGGSRRLPRKNVIDFLGKPIIAHTIDAAKKTALFDRVIVSTEDKTIAAIASQYGAEIDERLPTLATDQSNVVDVCVDFLQKQQDDDAIDTLIVLYATAPLRNENDISAVMNLLSSHCHFAMAVTRCMWPMHQALRWQDDQLTPLFPQWVNLKSAEMEPFYIDNGSTYAVHASQFLQQKTFYGDSLKAYLMPHERSVDIDTPADLATALYHARIATT